MRFSLGYYRATDEHAMRVHAMEWTDEQKAIALLLAPTHFEPVDVWLSERMGVPTLVYASEGVTQSYVTVPDFPLPDRSQEEKT